MIVRHSVRIVNQPELLTTGQTRRVREFYVVLRKLGMEEGEQHFDLALSASVLFPASFLYAAQVSPTRTYCGGTRPQSVIQPHFDVFDPLAKDRLDFNIMDRQLTNNTAPVTGSNAGIGFAVVSFFARKSGPIRLGQPSSSLRNGALKSSIFPNHMFFRASEVGGRIRRRQH
jgi:hypothetical protein